jgi:dihydroorotate dehydrogenase (fumarate)
MIDLKTKYLGLTLKNPIVVGASNLVQDDKILKKLEESGAAAIVYKSLFEEQIQLEALELQHQLNSYHNWDAEAASIFPDVEHAGPVEHLRKLQKAKKMLSIPLIASINAVYSSSWENYAKRIEEAGADALELNFYENPTLLDKSGSEIVEEQLEVVRAIKMAVRIPVSVKLSPYYTNIGGVVKRMDLAGADGFILFNRLFQPDIDIEQQVHHFPYNFSNQNDNRLALRYAGLLHKQVRGSIICSNGIHCAEDMIKMLLAGADAVQVVSVLYKKGPKHLSTMLSELEEWMVRKGYQSLQEFRGKLSKYTLKNPFTYKRSQYVDILMHSDELLEKYPPEEVDPFVQY